MEDIAIDPIFLDDAESDYFFTDLDRGTTGLPFVVWIAVGMGVRHGVRVWTHSEPLSLPTERSCLAIRPEVRVLTGKLDPEDRVPLRKWIDLNLDMIQKHWDGSISSVEVFAAVRSVG